MILEIRTYTLKPGKVDEYWQHYRELFEVFPAPSEKHLLGYFVSDIGKLNQIVHIWQFKNMAEREAMRGGVNDRPEWKAHLDKIRPLMVSQEVQILKPSPLPQMSPHAEEDDLIR